MKSQKKNLMKLALKQTKIFYKINYNLSNIFIFNVYLVNICQMIKLIQAVFI